MKRILKLAPADLRQAFPSSASSAASIISNNTNNTAIMSQKERLRAAVRGALGSRHPHEADISESQFLGDASSTVTKNTTQSINAADAATSREDDGSRTEEGGTLLAESQDSDSNPVDEM